jgi:hypothetical protein
MTRENAIEVLKWVGFTQAEITDDLIRAECIVSDNERKESAALWEKLNASYTAEQKERRQREKEERERRLQKEIRDKILVELAKLQGNTNGNATPVGQR